MRITIAVIACLFAFAAKAQYIDLQAGFAVASGSFGNNSLSKPENSFATNGVSSGLQVSYLFHKQLGICARVSYANFGIDESAFQEQLNASAPQGTSIKVESSNNFKSTSALAGPYLTLGKSKLTCDIRLMAGFLSLSAPGYRFITTYSGQEYSSVTQPENDAAIAFGWGVTAKYALPKDFYVSFNLDNVFANTRFNRNSYTSGDEAEIDKPYQAYLLTLGIGYAIQ